jgi:hypothetical protein
MAHAAMSLPPEAQYEGFEPSPYEQEELSEDVLATQVSDTRYAVASELRQPLAGTRSSPRSHIRTGPGAIYSASSSPLTGRFLRCDGHGA